jgi:hypothetical protein
MIASLINHLLARKKSNSSGTPLLSSSMFPNKSINATDPLPPLI